MNHKPFFFGICAFYALAAIALGLAATPTEPAPWQIMAAPVQTPTVAAWAVLCAIVLAALLVALRLAWNARSVAARMSRPAFIGMLVVAAVFAKFAATKSGLFDGGAPQTTNNESPAQDTTSNASSNDANAREQSKQQNPSRGSMVQSPSRAPQESTPRVYAFDAADVSYSTNYFAGRLYADPQTILSRDHSHQTLTFAPAQLPGDADTPVGALLSFYDLSTNIQAIVVLATLDGLREPSCATLLRSPNLVIQQAADDWLDPATITHCRFLPMGANRRMLVNNSDTSLVPRDSWAVITIEADALNPIDMTLATLGSDGNPRFGRAYWPGRIAEFVFIPREWQPDPESPPEPVPWDATLRNALESYLFHKHRYARAPHSAIPPGYAINHGKVDLVEALLGLPRVPIHGTLLMVR